MPSFNAQGALASAFATLRAIWNHPANRHSKWSAAGRYFGWQFAKRTWLHYYDLPYHGLLLRCYPDSHSASAALYFSGRQDFAEMMFIERYLRRGDSFVDVGANIGVYTLLAAARVGSAGVVHAFEPVPATFARLQENVSRNHLVQVRCHPLALSEHASEVLISLDGDDCVHSLATYNSSANCATVRCTTLDEHLDDSPIAMMKLDIEGAEPLALRGALRHLKQANPPVMQIEMDGYCRRFGISTDQFLSELEALDYAIVLYDVASNRLVDGAGFWDRDARNVLAVSRWRFAEVTSRLESFAALPSASAGAFDPQRKRQ